MAAESTAHPEVPRTRRTVFLSDFPVSLPDRQHAAPYTPAVKRSSLAATPIAPYEPTSLVIDEWDPATVDVARRVADLVHEQRPDLAVDHIGSSAVPGLPGKNVVDLSIAADPADVDDVARVLSELGFERQTAPTAFPPTRPMLFGSIEHDGRRHNIHAHVHPTRHRVWGRERAR